ncbi:MAG: hypothetical protein KKB30_17325 [Proteobacteria bacterium]|nr:hypothetical protein [Pseudomonadota bacterium]
MKKIKYAKTATFTKDFKKLLKRYKTLQSDLGVAKRDAIELYHLKRVDNQSVFPIPGFCSEELLICKVKKFACKALKGQGARSGIRIIYAFFPKRMKVVFIEIYFKGDRENESRDRITAFIKSIIVGQGLANH